LAEMQMTHGHWDDALSCSMSPLLAGVVFTAPGCFWYYADCVTQTA